MGQPIEAEKVLREMKEQGIEPDIVCYTSVIQAYKRVRNINKWWELFAVTEQKIMNDEFLISLMIRICAATHQAEKALMLFHRLETLGFVEYAEPYNSIIFALASRPEYARQAIEKYRIMQKKRIVPDYHTFVGVLKATSKYGDIPVAIEALDTMRNLGFEMNSHIYNGLIRTYAGACTIPKIEERQIESYVADAWALLDQMKEKDIPLNIHILDSMVLLHWKALFTQELHEQVLPLYERHHIEPSIYTYENLIQLYADIGENQLVFETYDRILSLNFKPNPKILRTYLKLSSDINDVDRIVDALETYVERKFFPPGKIINKLSKIHDPSDRLYVALRSLPKQYGKIRDDIRRFSPPVRTVRVGKKPFRTGGMGRKRTKKIRKKGF